MSIRELLGQNEHIYLSNSLYYQKDLRRPGPFETYYRDLREKENRQFPDELVKKLPETPPGHPLQREWLVRKKSLDKLVHYLSQKKTVHRILEVGCGNGWLSNRLSQALPAEICGLDVNESELKQASNLFAGPGVSFVYGSLWEPVVPLNTFDITILASSIQYFPDLKKLIQRLREFNTTDGEIHILDSPFYDSAHDADAARGRSRKYFKSLGFPEMADHYFHHTFNGLMNFNFSLMYNPNSFPARFQRRLMHSPLSPFPWIRIQSK